MLDIRVPVNRAISLLAACILVSAVACTPEQGPANTSDSAAKAAPVAMAPDLGREQAPMLLQAIQSGALPDLRDRIPINPRILTTYSAPGRYGGTLRRAYSGMGDRWGPTKLVEEFALEFAMTEAGELSIELNWVDRFEPNEDSTIYTVSIRDGLRWSDGTRVTTEDVRFWYDNVLTDERFPTTGANSLVVDDQLVDLRILDDRTFEFRFAESYPLFPRIVATGATGRLALQTAQFLLPSHYLQQFHPDYASTAELAEAAQRFGVLSWEELWGYGPMGAWWRNPELPVLGAWVARSVPPSDVIRMERNPFYHAVDEHGRQLPYLDAVEHTLFDVPETMELWCTQGLIDVQSRHVNERFYTVLKRHESIGGFKVVTWSDSQTTSIYLNQNASDPPVANLLAEPRFREALSVAIDRAQINEIYFNGLAEPRQASPVSGSPLFDASFESLWTSFDLEYAGRLLDELGLQKSSDNGMRSFPNGEPLSLSLVITSADDVQKTFYSVLVDDWRRLGLEIQVESLDRTEYESRARSGDVELAAWTFDRSLLISAAPQRFLGTVADGPWAPLWAAWLESRGANGVEPPLAHPIRKVWQEWEFAKSAPSVEAANESLRAMIELHRENIWIIGIVGEMPRLHVVNDRVVNFPDGLSNSIALREIGLAQPAQWWVVEEL